MGNTDSSAKSGARAASQVVKRNRLAMPDELPASIGVQFADERHAQGVVATDKISDVLKAFGLLSEEHISIPFQRIRQVRGDQFELRIENAGGHVVDGAPVVGHQWQYRQTLPERTA